jgi:hypothetical protein
MGRVGKLFVVSDSLCDFSGMMCYVVVSEASFTAMHPFAGERGGVCLAGPVTICVPSVLWALMTGSD